MSVWNMGILRFIGCRISGFGRNDKGAAAIEFAFIAPIMFIALFGAWEYSRLFSSEQKVAKVTGGVADLVARQPAANPANPSDAQVTCADIAQLLQITDVLMWPFDPTSLSVSIFNVRTKSADQTDVEIKWKAHNGRGTFAAEATATKYVVDNKLLVNVLNDEVVVVITKYAHPFTITGLANTLVTSTQPAPKTITLGDTTPMRPRVGPIRLTSATDVVVPTGTNTSSGSAKCYSVKQRNANPY